MFISSGDFFISTSWWLLMHFNPSHQRHPWNDFAGGQKAVISMRFMTAFSQLVTRWKLTQPVAKLFQLFGITWHLVGKISRERTFFFRIHWLSEKVFEARHLLLFCWFILVVSVVLLNKHPLESLGFVSFVFFPGGDHQFLNPLQGHSFSDYLSWGVSWLVVKLLCFKFTKRYDHLGQILPSGKLT